MLAFEQRLKRSLLPHKIVVLTFYQLMSNYENLTSFLLFLLFIVQIAENDRLQQLSIVPPGQEHEYNAMQAYLARNLLQLNMMEGVPVFSVPDKKSLHLGYVISCIEFVFENFLELRGDIGPKLIYLDIYDNTSQDFLFQVGSTGLIPLPNDHLGTLLQGLSREETWLYMTIMEFDLYFCPSCFDAG